MSYPRLDFFNFNKETVIQLPHYVQYLFENKDRYPKALEKEWNNVFTTNGPKCPKRRISEASYLNKVTTKFKSRFEKPMEEAKSLFDSAIVEFPPKSNFNKDCEVVYYTFRDVLGDGNCLLHSLFEQNAFNTTYIERPIIEKLNTKLQQKTSEDNVPFDKLQTIHQIRVAIFDELFGIYWERDENFKNLAKSFMNSVTAEGKIFSYAIEDGDAPDPDLEDGKPRFEYFCHEASKDTTQLDQSAVVLISYAFKCPLRILCSQPDMSYILNEGEELDALLENSPPYFYDTKTMIEEILNKTFNVVQRKDKNKLPYSKGWNREAITCFFHHPDEPFDVNGKEPQHFMIAKKLDISLIDANELNAKVIVTIPSPGLKGKEKQSDYILAELKSRRIRSSQPSLSQTSSTSKSFLRQSSSRQSSLRQPSSKQSSLKQSSLKQSSSMQLSSMQLSSEQSSSEQSSSEQSSSEQSSSVNTLFT